MIARRKIPFFVVTIRKNLQPIIQSLPPPLHFPTQLHHLLINMWSKLIISIIAFLATTGLTSNVIEATDDNLEQLLTNGKYTVLDLYASWCGHCKRLAPTIDELSDLFVGSKEKVQFVKIDADIHRDAGKKFNVEYFPLVKFLKPDDYEKKEIGEMVEARDLEELAAFVTEKTGETFKKPKVPESAVISLNDGNFDSVIEGKNALVAFTASWCGHCKNMKPEYEKLAALHKRDQDDLIIGLVDCTGEATAILAEKYDVKGYPTILYFSKDRADNTEFEAFDSSRSLGGFLGYLHQRDASFRTENGLFNAFAGRLAVIDDYLKEKGSITAEKVKELAGSSGDLYARYASKVAEKGPDYVTKEIKRLTKLVTSDKIAPEKQDELQRKLNVLAAFRKIDHDEL